MANLAQFNLALDNWITGRVPADVKKLTSAIAITAHQRVVFRTPTDTGGHRGGWIVEVGSSPATGQGTPDKGGRDTINRGNAKINAAPPFREIHITNNKEAILILEEGGFVPTDPGPSKDPRKGRKGRVLVKGGFSVQAPFGMVSMTFQELRTLFL